MKNIERMEQLLRDGHKFVMLESDRHTGEVIHYEIQGGEAYAIVDRISPDVGTALMTITPIGGGLPCIFPEHHHAEREYMIILNGKLKPIIDGKPRRVRTRGDVVIFEPGVSHGAEVYEETRVILIAVPEGR